MEYVIIYTSINLIGNLKCNKCNEEKEIVYFPKRKDSPDGFRNSCKLCEKYRLDKYYSENKEILLKKNKFYREENKEYLSERSKQYYLENKDKILYRVSNYYEENKDNYKIKFKEYIKNNKEKLSNYRKEYYKTPKGILIKKINHQKRRLQLRNIEGEYNANDILNLFESQNYKCIYCEGSLESSGKNKYHIDHIIPICRGGTNWISNIQLLCPHCNCSKHDKTHEEFLEYLKD